jgi:hypothetical protein
MIWSFVLAAIGILGLFLVTKKNYWGFAIGVFTQALWVCYAIVTHQYGFLITAVAYGFVYAKGFISWRTEVESERIN